MTALNKYGIFKHMKLSQRVNNTKESPIRKLESLARITQKQGVKIYHLNIGQPDIASPKVMTSWLKTANFHHLAYQESQGNRFLLKSLVKYYNKLGAKDIDEDNIIITLGGSEAILWTLLAIADYGNEVLVFEPFYTNVLGYASMAGVNLIPVTCKIENGFHLPSNLAIKAKLSKKTRAVYLCNPNNPTGTNHSRKEVERLCQFCRRHDLYLICDEVYRDFVYGQKKPRTALNLESKNNYGRIIVIDSFSKRYSMCGIRVGCLVCRDKNFIRQVLKYGQARLSAGEIDQQIAAKLALVPPNYFKLVKQEYQKRRDIVHEWLKKIKGAVFFKPEGAFYNIVKLPVNNAEKFCHWLLSDFRHQNSTVMLTPANGFYLSRNKGFKEVRIAYVINQKDLKKAMVILKKAVESWNRMILNS